MTRQEFGLLVGDALGAWNLPLRGETELTVQAWARRFCRCEAAEFGAAIRDLSADPARKHRLPTTNEIEAALMRIRTAKVQRPLFDPTRKVVAAKAADYLEMIRRLEAELDKRMRTVGDDVFCSMYRKQMEQMRRNLTHLEAGEAPEPITLMPKACQ